MKKQSQASRSTGNVRNGKKNVRKSGLKPRTFHLEPLEPRQLLSTVPFAETIINTEAIESETFRVTLTNAADTADASEQYVSMYIKSVEAIEAKDVSLSLAGEDVEILDSEQLDDGIWMFLTKMGLGSDYTVNVDCEKPELHVYFALAGDSDGNGEVGTSEYYTNYGEVLKGLGVSSRTVEMYKNMYNVDLTTNNLDDRFDDNNNGRLDKAEFRKYVKVADGVKLAQEITASPLVDGLKVNDVAVTEAGDLAFVSSNVTNPVLSGTIKGISTDEGDTAVSGKFVFNDGTNSWTLTLADVTTDGTYTTTGDSALSVEYAYDETNNTFTLTLPDGTYEGTLAITLWGGPNDTAEEDGKTLNLSLDATAPATPECEISVKDAEYDAEAKIYYTTDTTPEWVVKMTFANQADLDAVKAEVADATQGVYLEVRDDSDEVLVSRKLTTEDFEDYTVGSELSLSLTLADADALEAGAYTVHVVTRDLVGNKNESEAITFIVDTTAPDFTAAFDEDDLAENPDSTQTGAYTNNTTVGVLLSEVTEENLKSVQYSLDDGTSWTDVPVADEWFNVDLAYGSNSILVRFTDWAGQTKDQTLTILCNELPTLSESGESLETKGFQQSAEESTKRTIPLSGLFTDEAGLTYRVASSASEDISGTISDGVLSFTYRDFAEDEQSYSATLTVTATDAYGETVDCVFEVTYSATPTIANVVLANNTKYESSTLGFVTSNANIVLTGTCASPVGNVKVTIQRDGTDLGTFAGSAVLDDDGNFTANFQTLLGASTLTEGMYTLSVFGTDAEGNIITSATDAQTITVVLDRTAPALAADTSAVLTLTTTSTNPAMTNSNKPAFTVAMTQNFNAQDLANGVWAEIYAGGELYASGKFNSTTGLFEFSDAKFTVGDGSATFTLKILDAASNELAAASITNATITVDTTAPVWVSVGTSCVSSSTGTTNVPTGTIYTNTNTASFTFVVTETNGKTFYLNDAVYVAGTAVTLAQGNNAFVFKCTDEAGNTSDTRTVNIISNTKPTLTSNVPAQVVQSSVSGTVTVTLTEAQIAAMFADDGGASNLTYAVTGKFGANSITPEHDADAKTYTFQFTGVLDSAKSFGSINLTATDYYGETVSTGDIAVYKDNLGPVWTGVDTLEKTQDTSDTPSYTFDISDLISDPEGDAWSATAVLVNGSASGVVIAEGGKSFTWTPVSGKFGTVALSVTVSDTTNSEFLANKQVTFTKEITVEWAGPQISGTKAVSANEGAAVDINGQTVGEVFTIENLWNVDNVWNYDAETAKTLTWSFVPTATQEVHGTAMPNGVPGSAYTSLFSGLTIDAEGNVTCTLNENAYGTAAFELQVTDGTSTWSGGALTFNIANVAETPYVPVLNGSFQLTSTGTQYDLSKLYSAAPDEGTLELKDITFLAGTNVVVDADAKSIVVKEDGVDYAFSYSFTAAGMLTLSKNDDVLADEAWLNLSGISLQFTYSVQNTSNGTTEATSENCTLLLNSYAKNIELEGNQQTTGKVYTQNVVTGSGLDSTIWSLSEEVTLSFVKTSGILDGVVSRTGNEISVEFSPYDWGTGYVWYTLENGDGSTSSAKLYFEITPINFAPVGNATTISANPALLLDGSTLSWTRAENDDLSYVLNNVSTLFRDPEGGSVTVAMDQVANSNGTLTYDAVADTLTFVPTSKDYFGTVSATLSVTDTAVGTADAKTSEFALTFKVTNVNDAPTRTNIAIPKLSADAGETLTIRLSDYSMYFTDAENDQLTISLANGGTATLTETSTPGTYTFTSTDMGSFSFFIQASDGVATTAAAQVDILVAGSFEVQDQSLDVSKTLQEVQTGTSASTKAYQLAQSLTFPAGSTLGAGSVLKAGSVLGAGTALDLENIDGLSNSQSRKIPCDDDGVLEEDWTLPADVTFGTAVVVTNGTFAAGSKLSAGTTFTANTTISVLDVASLFAIYDDYKNDGTLLEQEISLGSYTGTVTSAAFQGTLPENSCFQSVEVRDNKVYVKYAPYSSSQDRSPVTVQVALGSGDTMDIEVSVNYAQPFEIQVNVVNALTETSDRYTTKTPKSANVTSIQPGTEYYIEVWAKCTLPLYQEALLEYYSSSAFKVVAEIAIPATDATGLTIGTAVAKDITSGEDAYTCKVLTQADDSLILEITSMFSSDISLPLDAPKFACGYDGTYVRAGAYKFTKDSGSLMGLTLSSKDLNLTLTSATNEIISGAVNEAQYARQSVTVVIPAGAPVETPVAEIPLAMMVSDVVMECEDFEVAPLETEYLVAMAGSSEELTTSETFVTGMVSKSDWASTLVRATKRALNDTAWQQLSSATSGTGTTSRVATSAGGFARNFSLGDSLNANDSDLENLLNEISLENLTLTQKRAK